jgi:xylulose-5-phosphate/fructose-6-phosphate phosphoketolase
MNDIRRFVMKATVAKPLSPDVLAKVDAHWRAANYLSVGQIYLYDNPLLTEPLLREHIKPRLWATGVRRRA